MPGTHAALLLLSDGRLPAGGYAHSGGLEPLIQAGYVKTPDDLADFLQGRAETVGLVTAAVAASACRAVNANDMTGMDELDVEFDARTPSPDLRDVSRRLGRQLVRVMRNINPHPYFDCLPRVPHQPVAMGVAAAAMTLSQRDAALAALYETVSMAAAAAPKLMHIDPFAVHAVLVRLTAKFDVLADAAVEQAQRPARELPANGSLLIDISAGHHARRDRRLFAS